MAAERRKERRLKANIPIKITGKNNLEIFTSTENISFLGAYIEVDRQIPTGTDVEVVLEIPHYSEDLSLAGEVKCKGDVFRCSLVSESNTIKYYGVGVFFTDFYLSEDRDRLHGYIDFLIENEEHDINEGLRRLRYRRDAHRLARNAEQKISGQEEFQEKSLELLKHIASRLEEIERLLQALKK
jgi:hypothetical protein